MEVFISSTFRVMTLVRVDLVPDAHYVAGKVSYSGPHSDGPGGFKFSGGDMECIVTPATLEKERITLINTDADKQFIKITDKNGVVYTDNFDIEYQEVIYISVVPKDKKIWTAGKYKITGSYTEVTIDGKKAYKITGPCTIKSDPASKRKYKLEAELQPHNKLYVNINGNGTSSDIYTEITTLYPNDIYYDDIIRYKLSTDDPNNYSPGDATVSGAHKNANNTYTVRDNVKIKVSAAVLAKTIKIKKLNSFQGILTIQYTKPDGTLAVETMNSIGSTEEIDCKITSNGKIFVAISPKDERYKKPDTINNDWIEATPSVPMQWIPVNNRSVQITASTNSEVIFKKLKNISVDLSYWCIRNISNYNNLTTIPANKLTYLNSGLLANSIIGLFSAVDKVTNPYASDMSNLTSIPKLNINTKYIDNMSYFAYNANKLTSIDLSWIDASSVISMDYSFDGCKSLISIDLTQLKYRTNNVPLNTITFLCNKCLNLKSIKFPDKWKYAKLQDIQSAFSYCHKLESVDLSNLDMSEVINISFLFYACFKLTTECAQNFINKINPKNCTIAIWAFGNCSSITELDFSKWNASSTHNIQNISSLVAGNLNMIRINLTTISTTAITDMSSTLSGCEKLKSLDLSNFNTPNLINIDRLASGCKNLEVIHLGHINTSNPSCNTYNIFEGCNNLKYIILDNNQMKFKLSTSQTLPATCKILVPSALIPTYQATQYWSEHASKFEPIENYTITRPGDGTVSVQSKIKGYCKFINNHGDIIDRIAFDKNGTLLLPSPSPMATDAPAGKHFFGWTFNNATDYTPAQVQAPGFFMIMINNGILETSLYAVYRT